MALLTLNRGSSSLKFSLIDAADGRVWVEGGAEDGQSVRAIVGQVRASAPQVLIDAVVHRVVHGGTRFTQPIRVTAAIRAALAALTDLAPLHNPPSLAVIDAALEVLPDVPHVAVFDTAFHATLPPESYTYPLPHEWTEQWSLRRFGFHGLSHAYGSQRALEMLQRPPLGTRLVIAHLGNGASVTAVRDGRSVDTSMGFTPMEGLMMGTRSGSVDPGMLLHLLIERGLSAEAVDQALNHSAGLLGVSRVSSDMREVTKAANAGNASAALAVAIFAHRARQAIGAMAVTLGGVDALVFTGGIGEHSVETRAAVCDGLSCLGLELDRQANATAQPDAVISAAASRAAILVVTAREDLMMARAAAALLASSDSTA